LSRDPERITSEKIEPNRTLYSHPSGAKPHAQHGSKPGRTHQQRNHTLGAPSFSPYRSAAPEKNSRADGRKGDGATRRHGEGAKGAGTRIRRTDAIPA